MRMRLTAFTLASLLLTRLTASPIQGPGTDALVLRDVESAASDDVINARGTHPLPSGKGSCGTTSNPERTVGAGALASTCEVLIAQLRNNTAHQVETTQPRWCYQNNPKDACCVQSVGNLQRFQTADYADNLIKWSNEQHYPLVTARYYHICAQQEPQLGGSVCISSEAKKCDTAPKL